jgi:hypothetical protein
VRKEFLEQIIFTRFKVGAHVSIHDLVQAGREPSKRMGPTLVLQSLEELALINVP